jgi:1-deoxy-D-xylulose-5-phosphate reductoisomerase
MRQRVAILGATGSIGSQALDIIVQNPERFEVVALACGRRSDAADAVAAAHPAAELRIGGDSSALKELVISSEPHIVLVATTGLVALPATIAALDAGAVVAIANKETIVAGGELVMAAARRAAQAAKSTPLERLRPVDSEHSALWQCLNGEDPARVERLWLTASGGPFRTWEAERISAALPAEALKHPTWSMGAKITIDSASLVNKGLEAIEAQRLYGVPMERVGILVHPESVVHALVTFSDGSTIAQLASADMRGPIGYALGYPQRMERLIPPVDLAARGTLTFDAPDLSRFPGLAIALAAGRSGVRATSALIAADDVAVSRFLAGECRFGAIPVILEATVAALEGGATPTSVEALLELDAEARAYATALPIPEVLRA